MSKLIEMPLKEGNIIIEVETTEGEIIPVDKKKGSRIAVKVEQSFEKVKDIILNSCSTLTDALKELSTQEPALENATLEFGINFTGEGNVFIVKTAAEGSIKVSLALKFNQSKQQTSRTQ